MGAPAFCWSFSSKLFTFFAPTSRRCLISSLSRIPQSVQRLSILVGLVLSFVDRSPMGNSLHSRRSHHNSHTPRSDYQIEQS